MSDYFCGIDFGTSNSAMSAGRRDKALSLIPLEGNNVTIPSAVFFNIEENRVAYGRQGIKEYTEGYEGRLLRSLKSILGSDLIGESTQVGKYRADFRSIIGSFIGEIKKRAELHIGHSLEKVVLGRPVRFVDGDDIADKRAETELRGIAEAQGFKNIHFEYEPIAAARDYESQIDREELVLVFDIGGGTSDFSVVRLSPDAAKNKDRTNDILANAGVHIGGTNFDQKLSLQTIMHDLGYESKFKSGLMMPKAPYADFSTWHMINFLYTQKSLSNVKSMLPLVERRDLLERFYHVLETQRGHELAENMEQAKIALSGTKEIHLDLNKMAAGWTRDIKDSDLKKSINSDIDKIASIAHRAVSDAGLKAQDINSIFMTGGSTGLPGFEKKISDAFPDSKIRYGDRFSSVASGLGILAQKYFA